MLIGTKYGLDRQYYWEQTRNGTEYIIRAIKRMLESALLKLGVSKDILKKVSIHGFLESCGADCVVNNCANLLGPDLPGVKQLQGIFPGWRRGPQLDDVAMLCFADPTNLDAWREILPWFNGADIMENRYMQLHVLVAKMMFDIEATWDEGRSYDEIYSAIEEGNSVGILLPGHYVAAGIDDTNTGDLRIKDSWGARKPEWKGNGFNQPLERAEFATVRQTVIYHKPAA